MSDNAGPSASRTEAIQAVVDRVSSYQDGAAGKTVETEVRRGFAEAGLEVSEHEVSALADAIESEHGAVDVSRVLSS